MTAEMTRARSWLKELTFSISLAYRAHAICLIVTGTHSKLSKPFRGRTVMKSILMAIMAVAIAVTFSAPSFAGEEKKKEEKKGGHVVLNEEKKKEEKKGGHVVFNEEKKKEEKKGGH
ncbi:hypothetical protein [Nitrospira lenta]|nr:hypothetical protein [Nitrospira lenta]